MNSNITFIGEAVDLPNELFSNIVQKSIYSFIEGDGKWLTEGIHEKAKLIKRWECKELYLSK